MIILQVWRVTSVIALPERLKLLRCDDAPHDTTIQRIEEHIWESFRRLRKSVRHCCAQNLVCFCCAACARSDRSRTSCRWCNKCNAIAIDSAQRCNDDRGYETDQRKVETNHVLCSQKLVRSLKQPNAPHVFDCALGGLRFVV